MDSKYKGHNSIPNIEQFNIIIYIFSSILTFYVLTLIEKDSQNYMIDC